MSTVAIPPSTILAEETIESFKSDCLTNCPAFSWLLYKTCVWLSFKSPARMEEPAAKTALAVSTLVTL